MSDLELDNLAETLRNVGTRHLFTLRLEVSPILNVGPTPGANRRMGVITGGEFRGQRLRGAVLSGGSDWISMRTDGSLDLNVRLILKTDDDALVAMTYHGIRSGSPETLGQLARGMEVDPSNYYFRIAPRFETAASQYGWMNNILAVGIGDRKPGGPIYSVFELL